MTAGRPEEDPESAIDRAAGRFARARNGQRLANAAADAAEDYWDPADDEAAALVEAAWQAADLARDDWRIIELREEAQRARERRTLRRRLAWATGSVATAASVALLVVSPFRTVPPTAAPAAATIARQRFATAIGEITTVALADGSNVVLDADSSVETRFDGTTRRIALLRGRALFHVAHEKRPFIVDGKLFSVRAVGTVFDVDSDEESQQLSMIEGTVVATARGDERAMTLHAGKSLAADRARHWAVGTVDVTQAGSWTRGELVFVDAPIHTIVDRMNRYSARRVVVDEEVGRHRLSAVLRAGDPGALISAIVSLGYAANPEGVGREIVIRSKD